MTGEEFEKLMKANGYNQTTLALRWDVVRQTIGNCCKAETVAPLYADAIKALAFEKHAKEIFEIVKQFNDSK